MTTAEFDDASLRQAIGNAEEIARLSPDNPEAMPVLGPQTYGTSKAYFDDVANVTPDWRVGCGHGHRSQQTERRRLRWIRRHVGIGPGGGELEGPVCLRPADCRRLQPDRADRRRIGIGLGVEIVQRAAAARPVETGYGGDRQGGALEGRRRDRTGQYTVVLEPAALGDLLAFLVFSADARQADEGRSFFSKKGGGNRIGEQVLGEKVNIYSDPSHALAPTVMFDGGGLPIKRTSWVEKGVWKDLIYSRFWAQKQNREPTGGPANLIMEGGNATVADLIAGTERGVLVTRFWHIRPLDPQTLLFTGLTRDGLFLIEKGKVTRPVKNMRWNESPIVALNNVDAMTPAERTVTGEGFGGSDGFTFGLVCPAARIREFTFSSASDAI